jgi:hypothetical protein
MILYKTLAFLGDEAPRPKSDAPLFPCLQITQFRPDIPFRLELTWYFLSSTFKSTSVGLFLLSHEAFEFDLPQLWAILTGLLSF